MDLAEIKERWRLGGKAVSAVDPLFVDDAMNWLISEHKRLTALCDEHRGEVDKLKDIITSLDGQLEESRAEVERLTGIVTALKKGCHFCQHPKRVEELTCQKNALQQVVGERDAEIERLKSPSKGPNPHDVFETGVAEGLKKAAEQAESALTRARAEGMEEGLKAAAETVYSAVCSYRSTVAQDEEGNGLELSDVLAHGYGDSDISRAKGELALLSDHIYCEIMNHEVTSTEACRLAEQANKGEEKG